MKVTDLFSPIRQLKADQTAEPLQVTFDPKTPQVTRVHLIPLKTNLRVRNPSLVLINGWYSFLVGPSWSDLLRSFILELQLKAKPGKKLSFQELGVILEAVVERMQYLYPTVSRETILENLNENVALCIAISHGADVPPEVQSQVSMLDLAKRLKAPLRMDLLISPMIEAGEWLCPLHCLNCYASHQSAMVVEKSLTTEEWKSIIDKCREAGIPQITFTGGEPTSREDLIELIAYARWHVTRLNTNGLKLTKQFCKKLFDADLDGIQLTLYSADAIIHNTLVGQTGAWKKTVAGIENAIEAGLSVSVNTPLIRKNSDYEETLRFIKNLGVKYATCSGLITTGAAADQIRHGEALTNSELMRVLKKSVKLARDLNIELMFTSPGWVNKEQSKELGLSDAICGACLFNMAVMPNGGVTACQSWLEDPKGLGNLLTTPWEKIWNDPLCRKMRLTTQDGCPLMEINKIEVER